jgi:hypothetical protein
MLSSAPLSAKDIENKHLPNLLRGYQDNAPYREMGLALAGSHYGVKSGTHVFARSRGNSSTADGHVIVGGVQQSQDKALLRFSASNKPGAANLKFALSSKINKRSQRSEVQQKDLPIGIQDYLEKRTEKRPTT